MRLNLVILLLLPNNPVEVEKVRNARDYCWSSVIDYSDKKIDIELMI